MPLFRLSRRTGPAFMLQNGPFSPKTRQIAFLKVNTGVSLPSSGHRRPPSSSWDVTKTAFWGVASVLATTKKNHSLHDATRNGHDAPRNGRVGFN